MHDQNCGASGLEKSERKAMFETGGDSAHLDALSAGQESKFIGLHSSDVAGTFDVNSATPGWDERPGSKLSGSVPHTNVSPEPLWDMSPGVSNSPLKCNDSIIRILADNNGRAGWIFFAALMIALGIGFGGGLASYQYLDRALPRQVNSSSHVEEPGKSAAKADKASRTTVVTSNTPKMISAPTGSQPSCAIPTSPTASQKTAPQREAISASLTRGVLRPEIAEREAPIEPVPETRPTTIEGWTVYDVRGEAITLRGPDGVRKVTRGETVPGIGRIVSVVRWGGRWIVATTSGLIATP